MAWNIEYSDKALKSLKKIDKASAKRIIDFLDHRLGVMDDPRILGKSLKGDLGVFWRYRVGDYRILCEIQDNRLVILAALIGHRRDIYQ